MKTKLVLALAALFAFVTSSKADFTPTIYDGPVAFPANLTPSGDYLLVPGIGELAGPQFFLAGGPFVDSTINNGTEDIGADLLGGSVLSSDVLVNNGGGNFDLILTIESTSGDLAPAGLTDANGLPLDTAAFFLGANAGGTPLDLSGGAPNSLILDAFLGDGTSIFGGPLDLGALGVDITTGSTGIQFGPGSAGIGIQSISLTYNFTKAIPEPTSAALLSVVGLGLVVRRRR